MEKNHREYLVTHIICVTHILLYDVKRALPTNFIRCYYMAKASGPYNACSNWLRARSEQRVTYPLCPWANYGLYKLELGLN